MTEWDWEARSPEFWGDLLLSDKDHVRKLDTTKWEFSDRALTVQNEIDGKVRKALHPNARLLLETIKQLEPSSVADCGFGFGDNLHNIGLLLGNADLYGYDISEHRLECTCRRSSLLDDCALLQLCDLGVPIELVPVELAFTCIVIMHILGDRHLVALRNVFDAATKHVVLMENWGSHPFMSDIMSLHESKSFVGWTKLYFYYRYSVEFARPHIMIISKRGDLCYERLHDYDAVLRQPLAKAKREGRP